MVLYGVIYHQGEQSHCGHNTSVKADNTCFLIRDTRILRQQKLQCSSKEITIPYILIYERATNFLTTPPILLNGTAETGHTSELMRETAETIFDKLFLRN